VLSTLSQYLEWVYHIAGGQNNLTRLHHRCADKSINRIHQVTPHLIKAYMAHTSLPPKRHLNQLIGVLNTHRDRHTDRATPPVAIGLIYTMHHDVAWKAWHWTYCSYFTQLPPPIWQISNYTALTLSVGWQERYAACKADYNLSTKVQANFYKGQFNKKSKINIAVTETTAHKYEQLLLSL